MYRVLQLRHEPFGLEHTASQNRRKRVELAGDRVGHIAERIHRLHPLVVPTWQMSIVNVADFGCNFLKFGMKLYEIIHKVDLKGFIRQSFWVMRQKLMTS